MFTKFLTKKLFTICERNVENFLREERKALGQLVLPYLGRIPALCTPNLHHFSDSTNMPRTSFQRHVCVCACTRMCVYKRDRHT